MPYLRGSIALAACAALALPAIASANIASTCVDADSIRVDFLGFRPSPYEVTVFVQDTMGPGLTKTERFQGPNASRVYDGMVGPGTVRVTAYGQTYSSTFPRCFTPTPPTAPEPPQYSEPPATTPPTVTPPTKKPPVKKPPKRVKKKLTCADIPRGAGIRWYNGDILGYRCPNPKRPPLRRVPVTG